MRGLTRPLRGWPAIGLAFALLVGCGVTDQTGPVPVEVNQSPRVAASSPEDGGFSVKVYFSRDGRLEPVTRAAPDTSAATALALLVAGPDGAEVASGLQTALAPQQLTATRTRNRTITVTATQEFTSISGDLQLLATAQVVWTVTGNAPGDQVQITVNGRAIQVPTDNGLIRRPVRRGDYMSVAPQTQPSLESPIPTPS